jgi:hypothetical protein
MILEEELARRFTESETGKPDTNLKVGFHFPNLGSTGFDEFSNPLISFSSSA